MEEQVDVQFEMDKNTWTHFQQEQVIRWVNQIFALENIKISNLENDFSDGIRLVQLVRILENCCPTPLKVPLTFHKQRALEHRVRKMVNCGELFNFLRTKRSMKIVGVGPEDIVDGKLTLVLGFIWSLIMFYCFPMEKRPTALLEWIQQRIYVAEEPNRPQKQRQALRDRNGPREKESMNKVPAEWLDANLPLDFTSSWRDGKNLARLIRALRHEERIEDGRKNLLEKYEPLDHIEKAIDYAKQVMKIPAIDPQFIVDVDNSDDQVNWGYLMHFRIWSLLQNYNVKRPLPSPVSKPAKKPRIEPIQAPLPKPVEPPKPAPPPPTPVDEHDHLESVQIKDNALFFKAEFLSFVHPGDFEVFRVPVSGDATPRPLAVTLISENTFSVPLPEPINERCLIDIVYLGKPFQRRKYHP